MPVWLNLGRVNTTDADPDGNLQEHSRVLALPDGGFVVIWEDNTWNFGAGLPGIDIVGQRYDVLGNKVGGEFDASGIYQDQDQTTGALALRPDGNGFYVAMQTEDDAAFGDGWNIIVETYNTNGSFSTWQDFRQGAGGPLIDDFAPALTTITGGAAEGYFLAYTADAGTASERLVGRYVTTAGVVGAEILLDSTAGRERNVQVTSFAANSSLVAGVYEDDSGTIDLFLINHTLTTQTQQTISSGNLNFDPDIARLSATTYVAVWRDDTGGQSDIKYRVGNASGGYVTTIATANQITAGNQSDPVVAAFDTPIFNTGGFVIVWEDGSSTIRGQVFTASGVRMFENVGSFSFTADAGTTILDPDVEVLGDGRIVVTYTVNTGGNTDVVAQIWDARSNLINGTSAPDIITSYATGGRVFGLGDNDTLYGSDAADELDGGAGNDALYGRGGNDKLIFNGGFDTLDGGAGNDTAIFTALNTVWVDLAYPGVEAWQFVGGVWVQLAEITGVENLIGSAGNDYLKGDSGDNQIEGGSGDDTLVYSGGYDWFYGRLNNSSVNFDIDTVDFSLLDRPVYAAGKAWTRGATLDAGTWTEIAQMTEIKGLVGTAFGDYLSTAQNGRINAGGGNDTMIAHAAGFYMHNAGIARFDGGDGTDLIDFSGMRDENGARPSIWVDLEYAGTEAWQLLNGVYTARVDIANVEDILGTSQNDYIKGNPSNNWLRGGGGNDILRYTGGFDWLWGGDGVDTVEFQLLDRPVWVDLMYSSGYEAWTRGATLAAGAWTAIADLQDFENIKGTAFGDYLRANDLANYLDDGLGDDTVFGEGGNDTFLYTGGFDSYNGGTGTDLVDFSFLGIPVWVDLTYSSQAAWTRGPTLLAGTWTPIADFIGIEDIRGTGYDDYLKGDAEVNAISGGAGADTLIGGLGADMLTGGAGADIFQYFDLTEASAGDVVWDHIFDFVSGTDKIDVSTIDANVTAGGTQDFIWSGSANGGAGTAWYDGNYVGFNNGSGTLYWIQVGSVVAGDFLF